jgi:hypothetical protein
MKDGGLRFLLLPLHILILIGMALFPAYASADASSHSLTGEFPALWTSAAVLGVAAVSLYRARRRRWMVVRLALALLVALFGFETAFHSVHHLADPQTAGSCAIFSASQHAPAACTAVSEAAARLWTTEAPPVVDFDSVYPRAVFRSPEGRAPPPPPSV